MPPLCQVGRIRTDALVDKRCTGRRPPDLRRCRLFVGGGISTSQFRSRSRGANLGSAFGVARCRHRVRFPGESIRRCVIRIGIYSCLSIATSCKFISSTLRCKWMPLQGFLVAPHFEWKRTVRYFEVFDYCFGTAPTALLVEPRGALVSNRAGEPGCAHPAFGKARFRIDDQSRGNARTSRPRRNIELIELITLQHAKAHRRVNGAGDAHTGQGGSKPFSEAFE